MPTIPIVTPFFVVAASEGFRGERGRGVGGGG